MTRVLYLCGGWPGHRPYEVATWATEQLHQLGFEVEQTTDPYRLDDDLAGYDLLVLGWTQALTTENLTPGQEAALLRAVATGTGVAGWHGMAASFRASLPYHLVIGGAFIEHPGGEGYPQPYDVTIVDRQHEVTAGVGDFAVASEQYYMHVDPNNHVLAETVFTGEHVPWLAGRRMPIAWVNTWGDGRVFYCSVGHRPQDLADPDVTRLVRQGLGWAARRTG
jgi:type 1 glutamine amidotransferase